MLSAHTIFDFFLTPEGSRGRGFFVMWDKHLRK